MSWFNGLSNKVNSFVYKPSQTLFDNNSMSYLYNGCENYSQNVYVPNYVTNVSHMMDNCWNFNKRVYIEPYTSNVEDMSYMVQSNSYSQDVNIPNSCRNWENFAGRSFHSNIYMYGDLDGNFNGYYQESFANSQMNGNVIFMDKTPYNMYRMFYRCNYFNRLIEIPEDTNAFQNCYQMFSDCLRFNQNVVLPDNSDSSYAFANCPNFNTNARLPRNSNIQYMFLNDTKFNSKVYVPESLDNALGLFQGCTNLNCEILFSNNIQNLISTFEDCTNFNYSLGLPSNIKYATRVFYNCTNLNTVIGLPNGMLSLDSTFAECINLNANIQIPSTVTDMHMTFSGCTNFNQYVALPSNGRNFIQTFMGCTNLSYNITFPESTINIYGVLQDTDFNSLVTLPSTVDDISYAFSNCPNYNQNFWIPDHTRYACGTFSHCPNLNGNIPLSNELLDISSIFYNSNKLYMDNIRVPESVTKMKNAFVGTLISNANIESNYLTSFLNGNMFISLYSSINTNSHTPVAVCQEGVTPILNNLSDPVSVISFNNNCIVNAHGEDSIYNFWTDGVSDWYNAFGGGIPLGAFSKNTAELNHGDLYFNDNNCFYFDYPNGWNNNGTYEWNAYWVKVNFF